MTVHAAAPVDHESATGGGVVGLDLRYQAIRELDEDFGNLRAG